MIQVKDVMKGPNEVLPFTHHAITYPQLASTKMDGFRLLNLCGEKLLSPALKPFPNLNMEAHLASLLKHCRENRIVTDGEFWSPDMTFQEIQSVTRSRSKTIPASLKYYIFDTMTEDEWNNENERGFVHRYLSAYQNLNFENCIPVEHFYVMNADEAQDRFESVLAKGEEGIILRAPTAKYKHGRTTENQDGMWKFKQFITQDAIVVGFEQGEVMREGLERTIDAQGKKERTYRQEDYTPIDMVGAFIVKQGDVQFKVKPGKGHDNEWKRDVWHNREQWLGKHIEFKFMPHGTMDKPRIGSLVRRRFDLD